MLSSETTSWAILAAAPRKIPRQEKLKKEASESTDDERIVWHVAREPADNISGDVCAYNNDGIVVFQLFVEFSTFSFSGISPFTRSARHGYRTSLCNSLQNASNLILFYQQRVNSLTLATVSARNSGKAKI